MTDPIADLLTRIRNAQTAKHATVQIPYSRIKEGVTKVLLSEGYIGSYVLVTNEEGHKLIQVTVRYDHKTKKPLINHISRVSKPGRRVYGGYQDVKPVRSGLGTAILTTPKGIVTDKKARELKVGGEVLCRIW